jgi:uncharacterized beta-barrel protein YwiB (DUF1934 family)
MYIRSGVTERAQVKTTTKGKYQHSTLKSSATYAENKQKGNVAPLVRMPNSILRRLLVSEKLLELRKGDVALGGLNSKLRNVLWR